MKKVLFIMLIAVLLVALAAPAFADKGGEANENADFGQLHKNYDPKPNALVDRLKWNADNNEMNLGQFIKEYVK